MTAWTVFLKADDGIQMQIVKAGIDLHAVTSCRSQRAAKLRIPDKAASWKAICITPP